jgi:putative ABC transport system ATP-binding protein
MFEGPRLRPAQRAAKADGLLGLVGMSHRARHVPPRLSVGERQRVAIARALANDPVVLLADEPTGNLDSTNTDQVLELFDRLHRQRGMTIVTVTHSYEVALRAERIIYIRDGRVVEEMPSHLDRLKHK